MTVKTKPKGRNLAIAKALDRARNEAQPLKPYNYPIEPPKLPPGVVPKGKKAPVEILAMDSNGYGAGYDYASSGYFGPSPQFVGFPGYPYLAMLSTRAEYRMFAQTYATQLTREWIVLQSTENAGESTKTKITELTQDMTELGLKGVIAQMAEHDSYFGRGQLLHNLVGQVLSDPLILSDKTIPRMKAGESISNYYSISAVEAMWTTPNAYNAINPGAKDFYKPSSWWMLGTLVHASRLQTVITRPVADMLKPAFNFGGMSKSQLAEPYVDNWLRTRQSVSDLIYNFSITCLLTDMSQILQSGNDDADYAASLADDLLKRMELMIAHRSNKGVLLLDKEREELAQVNTPLSGLDALQAQAQEQMCSVDHTPSTVLLGVAPTGFGNVAEGEIRVYNDWIAAQQNGPWTPPVETTIKILQMIRYGEIDPDIIVAWQPLYQMTPKELAEIRTADATTDAAYIDRQVISPMEVRDKLARNPESGYQGIDVSDLPAGDNEEGDLP